MEPIIKGWMWNISHWPVGLDGSRVPRKIFWYDSSNDLEFTKHTGEYQILIPESNIIASQLEIDYVHKHVKEISDGGHQFIRPNEDGTKWILNIPSIVLSRSMMLRLGI